MTKRMLSLLLCLVMALSMIGCGGSDDKTTTDAGNAGTETTAAPAGDNTGRTEKEDGVYRVLYSSEVTTLNYLTTSNTNEQGIGANVVDTLLEYDNKGNLEASLATEWEYDEAAKTWTFKIREGQKWIDTTGKVIADVTAQDFVDAMEYILTPAYTSSTAQNLFGVIANAEEYFDGQAGEGEKIDFAQVGVKAVDTYTLQYTLAKEVPYFLSMLTYVCFMPAYGPQLDELGAEFATAAEKMYYNGAYYISKFEPQVQMVLSKNPNNWDADQVFIKTIQRTYNEQTGTIGAEMAKRDQIDYTMLDSDVVDAWLNDPATKDMVSMERPSINYNYFYCFNFNMHKLNDDYNTEGMTGYSVDEAYEPENWIVAVNNENFRKSIMHAISRVATISITTGESTDPYTYIQNTITPKGFANNGGVDYTTEKAFTEILAKDFLDVEKAKSYKDAAMKELAGKATFPVKVLVRYNPTDSDWAKASTVLEQQLEAVLGTDYIDIIVEAGPSEGFLNNVRRHSDYMLMLCNWGADYADPETWTDPFYQSKNEDGSYNRGGRYAYLAMAITDGTASADTVKEYFRLVEAAKAITNDVAARYTAFAEAEAYLINHALVVPYGTSISDFVATKLNPWEGQYAAFGVSKERYKGQKLYNEFMSMDEYNAEGAK